MRDNIKNKLLEIDDHIYYGIVPDDVEIDEWNYFVFGQRKIRKSGTSGIDLNGYWYVTIVREDYIPDDVVFNVIQKMGEIAGLRLADGDFEYNYTTKGGTNIVVEILEIQFTKTIKRC